MTHTGPEQPSEPHAAIGWDAAAFLDAVPCQLIEHTVLSEVQHALVSSDNNELLGANPRKYV